LNVKVIGQFTVTCAQKLRGKTFYTNTLYELRGRYGQLKSKPEFESVNK